MSEFHDTSKLNVTPEEKKKFLNICIVLAVILLGVVCFFGFRRVAKISQYDRCVELALEGNWQDTIDTFKSLAKLDYKGSTDFYAFCQALQYYDQGNIDMAYSITHYAYHSKVTYEQKLKMLEFESVVRKEYEKIHGRQYTVVPSSSSGSSSNNSGNSGSSGSHSHSSGSNSSTKTDPYNAKDYANEDDFWEDYYNDFIDFDEAEQYWEDNH